MDTKYVFINDSYVAADQASLLITDLAIQRGYGIFDFFKTIDHQTIFLEDHLDRFYHSAQKMHLTIGYSREELTQIISVLQEKNQIPNSGIRMTLTGGYSTDGYSLPAKNNLVISQQALNVRMDLDTKGIQIVTYDYQRSLSESKTLDYAMAIWLQPFIKENGANDVLYHHNGIIREVPRANFFIVNKEQEVITAKTGILKGVMRKNILNLQNTGLVVTARDFNLHDLQNASEAFISSTTKHIMPVLKINGKDVGDGKAGKITAQLSALLIEHVKQQLR